MHALILMLFNVLFLDVTQRSNFTLIYSAVIIDRSTDSSSVNLRTLILDLSMQYSLLLHS